MRRLVVLFLLLVSLPLGVVVLVGPGATAAADRVRKGDLLTLAEATSIYDELEVKPFRDIYRYGLVVPRFSASPLDCDGYATVRGTSRVSGYYYTVRRRGFALSEDLVVLSSGREARALVQRYRDYVAVCHGTHDTDDGEGGYAQQRVRGWQPRSVGAERFGVLEAFIQEGTIGWRRTLVTRVGRTVVVLVAEPNRGTGSAKDLTKATRLAVAQLG